MRGKANIAKKEKRLAFAVRLLPVFWAVVFLAAFPGPFSPPVPARAEDGGGLARLQYKVGTAGVTIVGCDPAAARIDIPDHIEGKPVTNIATRAFGSCGKLTEVSLPGTLQSIGGSGFANCAALTRIELPEGLTAIGENAFYNCSSLREINIPAGLASFNPNIFTNCPSLRFTVAAANPHYTARDGSIYSKDMTALVAAGAVDKDSFTVPETVTAIGAGAFCNSGLRFVALGPGVKTIGEQAFSGCTGLQETVLNEGLESIGDEAFADTASLKTIALPHSLAALGRQTFQGSGLEKIDLSATRLETLPYGTFRDCARLRDITLGDGITVIEDAAFSNCAFTQITLPAQLRQIKGSFGGCASLESITFPYTLQNLGSAVFAGCAGLQAVYFEGNMPLRGNGFGTSVSNDVWTRENDSFSGLPLAVAENLKIYALRGARGWGDSFADFADGSGATTRISFTYKVFYYTLDEEAEKDHPRLILHPPESFAHLEAGSVSEPVSVVKAGLPADAGPVVWSSSDNSLAAVDDTGRVTALQAGVSDITASLTYNGRVYTGTAEVNVTGPETVFDWSVQRDGTAIINGFRDGIDKERMHWLQIPETIAGYKVTAIKNSAFADNPDIIAVTIPETVQTVGAAAFSGCIGVREVTLAEGLENIGRNAFSSTLIREIVVPKSVTRLQDYAFNDCRDLESATIKSGSLDYTLGTGLFRDCVNLKDVTLAEGITRTGGYTFAGCTALESVKLPASLQALGMYDFSGCTGLRTVELQGYLLGQETGISEKYNPFASRQIDFIRGIDNKHIYYGYSDCREDLVVLHPDDGNDWGSLFADKVQTGVRTASGAVRPDGSAAPAPGVEPGQSANLGAAPPAPVNAAQNTAAGDITPTNEKESSDQESPQTDQAADQRTDQKETAVFEIVKKTVATNPWLTVAIGAVVLAVTLSGGAGRYRRYKRNQ